MHFKLLIVFALMDEDNEFINRHGSEYDKYGHSMHSVLTINLIYNLKISKQSYAKEILLLILPMVRY